MSQLVLKHPPLCAPLHQQLNQALEAGRRLEGRGAPEEEGWPREGVSLDEGKA